MHSLRGRVVSKALDVNSLDLKQSGRIVRDSVLGRLGCGLTGRSLRCLRIRSDLQKGILGVAMKSPDKYSVLPEIGAVQKASSADKAKWRT